MWYVYWITVALMLIAWFLIFVKDEKSINVPDTLRFSVFTFLPFINTIMLIIIVCVLIYSKIQEKFDEFSWVEVKNPFYKEPK